MIKPLKRHLTRHLANNAKRQITFTGQKLSAHFNVKDKSKFEYWHYNIHFGAYHYLKDVYLGGTGRRILGRITDYNGRYNNLHHFKNAVVHDHRNACYDAFKTIGSGFRNFKLRLKESLLKAY